MTDQALEKSVSQFSETLYCFDLFLCEALANMTSSHRSLLSWIWLKSLLQLTQKSWWMSLLVWIVAIAPAQAALELRVAIERGVNAVTVAGSTDTVVRDGSGRVLEELPAGKGLITKANQGRIQVDQWLSSQVWVEPRNGGLVWIDNPNDGSEGRWYRGRTLVVPTSNGLTAVNYVDLEQYLYSVVGSEMPTNWPLEALKAQAVAARSYALYQRQTSANEVFDVGDTQQWQVYGGYQEETDTTVAAVTQTAGQVVTYNGQIIEAVFHSSSGGHTENSEDVWVNPLPYLRAVEDYDQLSINPVYQWNERVSAAQLQQIFPGIGNIISLVPQQTTQSGRIVKMQAIGDQGRRTISGDELRRALKLRSTLIVSVQPVTNQIASAGNTLPPPTEFLITGRGFGHGLGMSQWGACGMALRGVNYRDILTHYYTGTTLARIRVE